MRAMSAPDIPGYRILRPLNSGGMATVYLAEQLSLGREVAIKLIADHLRTDAGFAERFAQEARIASRLDHPHIVTVFDYGTVPDGDGGAHHYLVMARIEGADYHRALPGLSLPERLRDLTETVGIETGETTAISSISGLSVVFLHVRESRQPIRYSAEVGTTVPIHASSAGRAILAQMTLKERDSIYRKLQFERWSETTPMSIRTIEDALRDARVRGWHESDSEYIPDLAGVSLPLPYGARNLSLVVAGPVSRCLSRRPQIAQTMRRAMEREGLNPDLPLLD